MLKIEKLRIKFGSLKNWSLHNWLFGAEVTNAMELGSHPPNILYPKVKHHNLTEINFKRRI